MCQKGVTTQTKCKYKPNNCCLENVHMNTWLQFIQLHIFEYAIHKPLLIIKVIPCSLIEKHGT